MTTIAQKVENIIDHVRHRRELCDALNHTSGVTKLARQLPPELAERVLALPTPTAYENQRRIRIMENAATRDEVEEQIGIPRRSLYTWLHRRPETQRLWQALPARSTGRTSTKAQMVERRVRAVREARTLAEAANRLRVTQADLEQWLYLHGFGDEAKRLRAAQKSAQRQGGDITSAVLDDVERDPLTWAKAVLNTPDDLGWYFGPPPVERVRAGVRRVVEVTPKLRGVRL